MELSEEGFNQFRLLFGQDLSHDQIQSMIARFTKEDEVIPEERVAGDSDFTYSTLPNELTKMVGKEVDTERSIQEFDAYTADIKSKLETNFGNLAELNNLSASKWCELFRKIFKVYPGSQEILTTKEYEKTDFKGRKIMWNIISFKGHPNVKHAIKLMNDEIMDYLKKKNLVNCLSLKEDTNVRNVWMEACKLENVQSVERVREYLNDTFSYWGQMKSNSLKKNVTDYIVKTRQKYDINFLNFMEALGLPVYFIWLYWRTTPLEKPILKSISEQYLKFKADPEGTETFGLNSWVEKWNDTISWCKGYDDHNIDAEEAIQNRKRNFGNDLVHLPNAKKSKWLNSYVEEPSVVVNNSKPPAGYTGNYKGNNYQPGFSHQQSAPNTNKIQNPRITQEPKK